VRALTHAKGKNAVQSDDREAQRDAAEDLEHRCAESPWTELPREQTGFGAEN
jgi:hypothetical protein